jgi:multiple sugar transport system substrate-binding protein
MNNSILRYCVIALFNFAFISCKSQDQKILSFWGLGSEGEYVQKLIPEFESRNPGVKIKAQMIPWTAAQEKLITAYASNNLPDAFQIGNTWIPQFVALNALENLDQWIKNSEEIDPENYFSGIWETNTMEGSVFGIPWYIDTRVLFYRKDILTKAGYDKPPISWKELYDLSEDIKALFPEQEKYAIYLPTNEWATFAIFGLQNGSNLLRDNNCFGNFSSSEFKTAFDYLIQFHKSGLAPKGISQVTNVYQAFAEGYFSLYISGPWNIMEFKKWMKGELADKWMTAPLPSPEGRGPGISLAGGSSLVISKVSRNKKAIWKFVEYLSQPATQLEFFQLIYDLPAVKSAWNDSSLINDPYMKAFYTQFENVKSMPKVIEWEQIAFSKIQQYAELAAMEEMTVEESLRNLDKATNQILEKRRWLLNEKQNIDN